MKILQRMNGYDDLARLSEEEQIQLCKEIREFLLENVSKTGGHLASNLGVVELTVALETVFDTRKDRLVFDVGHQSYVHKMLTGRQADFAHLRQFGGISGFPKPSESETDAFVAGHASSAVSIALGMARARTLTEKEYHVVALLGDGAATGGMAYEGLNDAAVSQEPMIIILNDNEMSISTNVGGISRHLSRVRSSQNYLHAKIWYRTILKKLPGGKLLYRATSRLKNSIKRLLLAETIFENMGLTYLGPADGHDLPGLIALLNTAKDLHEPVLVHVVTKKGNGYRPAQDNPTKFHGIGKFEPETGMVLGKKTRSFSDSFGDTMVELGKKNPQLCAITAAMPAGTGLLKFMREYPKRTFDVGIAEEHAVSMAGGLAKQGMIPVVALYSTFLQRSYDQIMQDICLLHLHVILAIDRAGLVGDDGPTHHGVFDVGFLRQMPGMMILAPVSMAEQTAMLHWAVEDYDGPIAIRYPRGTEGVYSASDWNPSACNPEDGMLISHRQGNDVVFVTYGSMLDNVMAAAEKLSAEGVESTVIRLLTLSPLPTEKLVAMLPDSGMVIVVEEAAANSGISGALSLELRAIRQDCRVLGIDLGREFVQHGSKDKLYAHHGLNAESISEFTKEALGR